MKKINFYLIIILVFLTSCQSIKDGLSGNKAENSDEFLVKKKSPLVMPPKFMELPKPSEEILDNEITDLEKTTDIQNILDLEKLSKSKSKKSGSAEDFVLKEIKKK
tara:strand:+ start:5280 stop:5597 length:318 start_codon:yes stop_codon:yes gene_type:complete